MNTGKLPPERRAPTSVTDAAQRLAAIVEAAEVAASSVIDDAEAQARKRLEEADARADRVIAERLRALADELDPLSSEEERPSTTHLRPVEDASGDGEQASHTRRAGSGGARLLATQMAVSGASREEIGIRLRNGFEVEDVDEILDAILGPEG